MTLKIDEELWLLLKSGPLSDFDIERLAERLKVVFRPTGHQLQTPQGLLPEVEQVLVLAPDLYQVGTSSTLGPASTPVLPQLAQWIDLVIAPPPTDPHTDSQ